MARVAASAAIRARSSSASARFRSMNWPTWPPTPSTECGEFERVSRAGTVVDAVAVAAIETLYRAAARAFVTTRIRPWSGRAQRVPTLSARNASAVGSAIGM